MITPPVCPSHHTTTPILYHECHWCPLLSVCMGTEDPDHWGGSANNASLADCLTRHSTGLSLVNTAQTGLSLVNTAQTGLSLVKTLYLVSDMRHRTMSWLHTQATCELPWWSGHRSIYPVAIYHVESICSVQLLVSTITTLAGQLICMRAALLLVSAWWRQIYCSLSQ